jgi:superfamily I DNA/RNA helicase
MDCIDKLFSLASCLDNRVQGMKSPQNFHLELEKLKKSNHILPTACLNKNSIYLMTSHMSKGLEFDHVIALGISTRIESEIKTVIKRSGDNLILGPNTKDKSSMLALCDLDAEKLRQMYVAITRAKMCVHIPLIKYEVSNVAWGALSPFEYYLLNFISRYYFF